MKIFFASDHAGFALKNVLTEYVRTLGYEVEDVGAHSFDSEDDYPDFITPCAQKVAATPDAFGIIVGGSGQGEAMAANRILGARAAVFYGEPPHSQTDAAGDSLSMISSVREHNDANILSLGARFISVDEAKEAVKIFLSTPFSKAPRHTRRLAKF